MIDSYLLLLPVLVAIGTAGGVWLHSKLNPGLRPARRTVPPKLATVPRIVARR